MLQRTILIVAAVLQTAASAADQTQHTTQWDGESMGKGRAYALSNPQEYFAETTEAFFGRNDFQPFDRAELQLLDPEMCTLLERLWSSE